MRHPLSMTGPLLTQPWPELPRSQSHDHGARWLAAMHAGDFTAAWNVSDTVLAGRDPATRNDAARPYHERWVWDGKPLGEPGRRRKVLVRCYHGLGDTLQFWRYVPMLQRQADVVVEVQPELIPLLAGTVPMIPFDPANPAPAPHDVEIMELGHALRTLPPPAPYLHVKPMVLDLPRPIIGVCWAAGGWDPGRDAPWRALAGLSRLGTIVSLQRGPAAADAPWLDPLRGSMALTDTAGLLAALDHVVTVDTMIAHLAGALGRPLSVLLQADADWRWMRGRDDSPWYQTARLYRQPKPNDWDTPAARIIYELAQGT